MIMPTYIRETSVKIILLQDSAGALGILRAAQIVPMLSKITLNGFAINFKF